MGDSSTFLVTERDLWKLCRVVDDEINLEGDPERRKALYLVFKSFLSYLKGNKEDWDTYLEG